MPPIPMKLKIERTHFLLTFAATVLVLFIIRCIHPEIAFDRLATAADTTAARPIRPDSIAMERPKTLCIRDTGIGIAPEDLPRVFEKSYTGYNGRVDKKASGIGLYLCKRVCDNLGHRISIRSAIGEGTTVCIDLEQRKLQLE